MLEVLGTVRLGADFLTRYPRELSRGQCQRVASAKAFACVRANLQLPGCSLSGESVGTRTRLDTKAKSAMVEQNPSGMIPGSACWRDPVKPLGPA